MIIKYKNFSKLLFLVMVLFTFISTAPLKAVSSVEQNTDRVGSDYRDFALKSPNYINCKATCEWEKRCKAWTYVRPGIRGTYAHCFLKYAVPKATRNNNCISGVIGTAASLSNCDVVPNGDQGTDREFSVRRASGHLNTAAGYLRRCSRNAWSECQSADYHLDQASRQLTEVLNYAVEKRCLKCNLKYAIQVAKRLTNLSNELYRKSWLRRTYSNTEFNLKQWRNTRPCPGADKNQQDPTKTQFWVINVSGHGYVPHWGGASYEWTGDNDEILSVPPGGSHATLIDNMKKTMREGCCKGIWGMPGQEKRPRCWSSGGPTIRIVNGPYNDWATANRYVIRNTWRMITDRGPSHGELKRRAGCR